MYIRPFIFSCVALGVLGACDSNDGPLEKAGETIDNTVDETADTVEDSVEDVQNQD